MTPAEEKQECERWYKIVNDIRGRLKIEEFANRLGVTERTICNWQNGGRPMGFEATRVYLLHVELFGGNPFHRNALPSEIT